MGFGFRVSGAGFRAQGIGFRVYGSGLRFEASTFYTSDLETSRFHVKSSLGAWGPTVDDINCITLRTLNYGNYGTFLIAGNAGFISSTVVWVWDLAPFGCCFPRLPPKTGRSLWQGSYCWDDAHVSTI